MEYTETVPASSCTIKSAPVLLDKSEDFQLDACTLSTPLHVTIPSIRAGQPYKEVML